VAWFSFTISVFLELRSVPAQAQQIQAPQADEPTSGGFVLPGTNGNEPRRSDGISLAPSDLSAAFSESSSAAESALPAVPEPAVNPEREEVPYAAKWHQQAFSRVGIGADVSPLGIGIHATTPLDDYFDLRVTGNFFGYTTGRIEVDGFNIIGNVHMATLGTSVDFYPWDSVWRVSGGLMLVNGNQFSAQSRVASGTSFTLDGQNYYSSNADPVSGSAVLGLNTVKPAPMFSFGFGRYVPHSNRHWSFPTEFGAIYMGAPTFNVNVAGTVCTDKAQTMCSDLGDASNPVTVEFNQRLQGQLARWRKDLQQVPFYPIFSYGVVYSFNTR
jgi:hypothetical protein